MEDIRSIDCKNPLTAIQLILFVVRMWLKHHLLSQDLVSWSSRLGASVLREVLYQNKKKSRESSKIQTPKRLIRNRVKNVITVKPSNKSKTLYFVKTLLGYSHPVN